MECGISVPCDWWNTSTKLFMSRSGCFWLFFLFFFFFPFYSHTRGIWKFPGQGSNRSYSCWPTPQPQQHQIQAESVTYATAHGNTGSLTHWAKPGVEPASSQRQCWVLNPMSHNRNSRSKFFLSGRWKSMKGHVTDVINVTQSAVTTPATVQTSIW